MVCGGGDSLEGENESVWWSEKEKERERKVVEKKGMGCTTHERV